MGVVASGTISADGSTASFPSGKGTWIHTSGTFGGGTITVQMLAADGTTWVNTDKAVTAAEDVIIVMPEGASKMMRLTTAGSTTPSVYWEVTI